MGIHDLKTISFPSKDHWYNDTMIAWIWTQYWAWHVRRLKKDPGAYFASSTFPLSAAKLLEVLRRTTKWKFFVSPPGFALFPAFISFVLFSSSG